MSLERLNNCGDNYDTAHVLTVGWPSSASLTYYNVVSGITGFPTNCLRMGSGLNTPSVIDNFDAVARRFAHVLYMPNALPSSGYDNIIGFLHSGAMQVVIAVSSAGSISAWKGIATPYAGSISFAGVTKLCESSNGVIAANVAVRIGVDVVVASGATGSVVIQVNGTQVANATSVVTSSDATSLQDQVSCIGPNPTPAGNTYVNYFDDFIVCNASGTYNKSIPVPQKVYWMPATGPGMYTQFTHVGAATNWQCVTDSTPQHNSDTTYVNAASYPLTDGYALTTPSGITTITGMFLIDVAKIDSTGGAAIIQTGIGNGTDIGLATYASVGSTYSVIGAALDTNPITGLTWAVADLTTLQKVTRRYS